jgi:hypothetical protein
MAFWATIGIFACDHLMMSKTLIRKSVKKMQETNSNSGDAYDDEHPKKIRL